MSEPHIPDAVIEPANDPRAVLLKPGDLLVIGNVGSLPVEAIEHLDEGLRQIKEALGIEGVLIFENDVSVSSIEERVFRQFKEGNRG